MTSGKAHGKNRDYQVLARNILQKLNGQGYVPYSGDGIDVQFKLAGTGCSLDVALIDTEGNIMVAECKRWKKPIDQESIFAFAQKVEQIRKNTTKKVAGVFFTQTNYQEGFIKVATFFGIEMAICNQDQSLPDFILVYLTYDPIREKHIQEAMTNLSGSIQPKGHLVGKIIHADGTSEDDLILD